MLRMRAGWGVVLMAGAMACFAAMDTTTKVLAVAVPALMVVWARYVFQLAVITATHLPRRGAGLLKTRHPGLQAARALLMLSTTVTGFYGIRAMPLAEFTAIVLLTPLALTALAALQRSDAVSWIRWVCVFVGFGGALLMLRPGLHISDTASWLALAIVVANTGHQWLTSRTAQLEDPATTQFYSGAVGALLASIALPLGWQTLGGMSWALILLACVLGFSGHQLLIHAYRQAPVSQLAPYLYLQLAFATLLGWLVFSQVPDGLALAGLGLIAVSGIMSPLNRAH